MEGKLLNYNVAWVSFSSDDLKQYSSQSI